MRLKANEGSTALPSRLDRQRKRNLIVLITVERLPNERRDRAERDRRAPQGRQAPRGELGNGRMVEGGRLLLVAQIPANARHFVERCNDRLFVNWLSIAANRLHLVQRHPCILLGLVQFNYARAFADLVE